MNNLLPPPPNLEHMAAEPAERRIVGACMMYGPRAIGRLVCNPAHMSNVLLREMLSFAVKACAANEPFDMVATARFLSSIGRPLKEAVIVTDALSMEGAMLAGLAYECRQVEEAYARRMAYMATNRMRSALEAGDDIQAATMATEALEALGGAHSAIDGPISIGDAAAAAFAESEIARVSGVSPGIQTSLRTLNERLGGFQRAKAYFIGGRPGHGKTVLMMDIMASAGEQLKSGLVFSLEMSAEQLAARRLATLSGVTSQRIERGQYSADEAARIMTATEQLQSVTLHIDDRGGLTVPEIAACCRVHKARHGLDIIGIDYAQLVKPPKGTKGEESLSKIVKGLNQLKKTFNCPVVILAQPNRQCDTRPDRRPMMADFHGSSEFEKAADVIIFVYREAAYADRPDADQCLAEFIFAKNRGGTCGVMQMRWDGPRQTFSDN